jgi:hypothetical protein
MLGCSLATAAAQANLSIKMAESLRHLLPGYSTTAVISALAESKGDIEEAADILLASGPPTEAEDMVAAFVGLDLDVDLEDQASGLDQSSDGLTQQQLVDKLVHSFQGLDAGLAGFLLQQCDGDFARTAKFIAEEVLGTSLPPPKVSQTTKVSCHWNRIVYL